MIKIYSVSLLLLQVLLYIDFGFAAQANDVSFDHSRVTSKLLIRTKHNSQSSRWFRRRHEKVVY